MNSTQMISILDGIFYGLNQADRMRFELVMHRRGYTVYCDRNTINRQLRVIEVFNRAGTRVFRYGTPAIDFWERLAMNTKECLLAEFSLSTKVPVVVGKSLLIPFPDKQLSPASAP